MPSGCWEWTGATSRGYGVVQLGRGLGVAKAHRVAYIDSHGHHEIEVLPGNPGGVIRHDCDNRLCVRPDHLRFGSQKNNVQDIKDRDRQAVGEEMPHAKLTEEAVLDIREKRRHGMTLQDLADQHDVSVGLIHGVVTGKRWRHVE